MLLDYRKEVRPKQEKEGLEACRNQPRVGLEGPDSREHQEDRPLKIFAP